MWRTGYPVPSRLDNEILTSPLVSAAEGSDIRPNAKSGRELLVKRIQTLGGLAVFEGPRPLGGNAQQPRRLAILAVLARAGDRGVSRDRLAGLLWGLGSCTALIPRE